MTLGTRLVELARLTLQDPQRAAQALLAEGVPLKARSAGLLLVAILSALLASLQVGGRESLDPFSAVMLASPIRAAVFQWLFLAVTVFLVHRVGRLEIGESSVMIAVSSPHRREAFEACHFAIDTLKETVPVWKKEYFEDGEVWVGLQSECEHRH